MADDIEMARRWGPKGSRWAECGQRAVGGVPPLGVILGGHDHEIMYENVAGCQIIKVR